MVKFCRIYFLCSKFIFFNLPHIFQIFFFRYFPTFFPIGNFQIFLLQTFRLRKYLFFIQFFEYVLFNFSNIFYSIFRIFFYSIFLSFWNISLFRLLRYYLCFQIFRILFLINKNCNLPRRLHVALPPAFNRASATSGQARVLKAVSINGVNPSRVCRSGFAPALSNIRTIPIFPCPAAQCKAENP